MIAISYRRQDSSPVAGRLYDRLQAEFGKGTVFMDFDSIPYGVDFREHIKTTLQRAKVVIAIIGPEWCGGRDPANRRIDDPTDFVRLEVASALENGIPIIPVLVNNTPMPEAKSLPAELEGLAFRNGLALDTGIDFHHHADRLIAGIHRVVDPPAPPPPPPAQPTPPKAEPPRRNLFPMVAAVVLLLALAAVASWYFLVRAPRQVVTQVVEPARTSETPAAPASTAEPTAAQPQPQVNQTVAPTNAVVPPPATTPAVTALSPSNAPAPPASTTTTNEIGREYTYSGKIGAKEATFRLRFEAGERVTGTYSQGAATYRLEGRNPKGKLSLDEYTGERVTAHIELSLAESSGVIRWEGTMRNTPPDNRSFPVSFQPSSASTGTSATTPSAPTEGSDTVGEFTYRGKVGPYDATFQLRFEPGGRVSGTYTMPQNPNLVLRLEGRNPKGKLFLDEYTRDKLSARIELSLNDSASDIRWEGTMYNTPPDNRVFPVTFSRPRK
jgi:TIR domain-containing protein